MSQYRYCVTFPIATMESVRDKQLNSEIVNTGFFEIYAQPYEFGDDAGDMLIKKTLNKEWYLMAVPLKEAGNNLYEAGITAGIAVSLLRSHFKRPIFAIHQFFFRKAWIKLQRLYPASKQNVSDGESCQLALATALIMSACNINNLRVYATGALEKTNNNQYSAGKEYQSRTDDNRVYSVGLLPIKLEALINLVEYEKKVDNTEKILLFIPSKYQDKTGKLQNVNKLEGYQTLSAHKDKIKIVPVAWLSDVVKELGAAKMRLMIQDRLALACILILLITSIGLLSWNWWLKFPIPVSFLPGGILTPNTEPFRVCYRPDKSHIRLPLLKNGIENSIPTKSTIGWKVKFGDESSLNARIGKMIGFKGYHIAYLIIGENSGPLIKIPTTPNGESIRLKPGTFFVRQWQLDEIPERNVLILLAKRNGAFDLDEIHRRLYARFAKINDESIIGEAQFTPDAAANFIIKDVPGGLKFFFDTKEGIGKCSV